MVVQEVVLQGPRPLNKRTEPPSFSPSAALTRS
jgi:hypothetical protein